MSNTFLPDNYSVPKGASNYMKFQQGQNRFRIMGALILGFVYWLEQGVTRTPVRVRTLDDIDTDNISTQDIKHFWAMPVYNYQEEAIQILEITQKTIQEGIKALSDDEDWGDPSKYDIVVTKTGEKMETKYTVQPKPAKEAEAEVIKKFKEKYINLEALYDGKDPFKKDEENGSKKK